jgi:hypothetical protein
LRRGVPCDPPDFTIRFAALFAIPFTILTKWCARAGRGCLTGGRVADGLENKERIKQGEEVGKIERQSPQIPVIV